MRITSNKEKISQKLHKKQVQCVLTQDGTNNEIDVPCVIDKQNPASCGFVWKQ